ncbi:MAG: sigma-70 family RNA polymerase sigma factor [Thermoguttaceae bacterium]
MNQSQFHRLFLENQRRLFGFVLTFLPRIDQAEEVFQNVCVILLDKFDQFEPDTSFIRWACQIARYEVLSFRRQCQRKHCSLSEAEIELLAERQLDMGPQLESRQTALRHCLKRLRLEDRRLIEARYAGNTNSRALAESLQMCENTVYKALGRIRRALRRCVDAKVAQEDHA